MYGTLRDPALRAAVLGREAIVREAVLPDHAVFWAEDARYPVVTDAVGQSATGLLLQQPDAQDLERLKFYEGLYDYSLREVQVLSDGAHATAQVFFPPEPGPRPGAPWDLGDWQDRFGPVMREAAPEIMSYFGTRTAAEVAARMSVILTRAQARVNAAAGPAPTHLRRGFGRDEVAVADRRRVYSKFFTLEEIDVTYPQFKGPRSDLVERAVFVSADAVTVLPYDPVRDEVLLIEQFRAGPYLRGDARPWGLEAIAGRIDAFETPEQAARREAREEAGLELGDLHRVARYYASPGAKTEYLYSFISICDLSDHRPGVGGLDSEAEDIRSFTVSFDTLEDALNSGEIENAPLMISVLWLRDLRPGLQGRG